MVGGGRGSIGGGCGGSICRGSGGSICRLGKVGGNRPLVSRGVVDWPSSGVGGRCGSGVNGGSIGGSSMNNRGVIAERDSSKYPLKAP